MDKKSHIINIYIADTDTVKNLDAFCEARGIYLGKSREFVVELKEMPKIFVELESIGCSGAKEKKWMLAHISDEGISLYICITNVTLIQSMENVEASIFIPKENIICIHSITKDFFEALRKPN